MAFLFSLEEEKEILAEGLKRFEEEVDYPYEVSFPQIMDFSDIFEMPLEEIADYFPPPYVKMFREVTGEL